MQSGLNRADFRIVSKAGYVASSDLNVHDGEPMEPISNNNASSISVGGAIRPDMFKSRLESTHELIDLGHLGLGDVYHSMHPSLLQQQLEHSLDALQTDYIDSYLIHNPEHYLQYKQMLDKAGVGKTTKDAAPQARTSTSPQPTLTAALPDPLTFPPLEEKLLDAFITLEEAVRDGKIRSYGISSNWLAYAAESQELNYKEWINLSESAYRSVNAEGATHGRVVDNSRRSNFRILQFPGNIIETYGLDNIGRWAKTQGLEVMVNRPLDALDAQGQQWRLATYSGAPRSVYNALRAKIIEHFQDLAAAGKSDQSLQRNAKFMSTLITDLDRELYQFQSVYHYQQDFSAQIMPMLIERMSMMQDPAGLEAIQTFLEVYERKVRQHCSVAAEEHVASLYKGKYNSQTTKLQDFALNHLLSHENVDIVLNGMTRESYVDEGLELLQQLSTNNKSL